MGIIRHQNRGMVLRCIRDCRLEKEIKELSFDVNSERLKQDSLDTLEEFKSDVMCTTKYDENSDTGMSYLGTSKMKRQDELIPEHNAPITENCQIPGNLLVGTDHKILLYMGASKSFMSKTFYLNWPSLHSLSKLYQGQRIF